MQVIYISIIIVLLVTNIITFVFLFKQRKYAQVLFNRAWQLELKLIHIYHRVSEEDVKLEIEQAIANIKPLS